MQLIDPFGRTVRDLRISITDRCNFRCTYCMPEEGMAWLDRKEILSFEDNANKKDSIYWNMMRPVPLTEEENNDYLRKDSIQTLRKSKPYLDSIDRKNNKFKILKVLNGYSYQNSE